MTILGVKASSIQCEGGYQGFYRIPVDKNNIIERTIDVTRKSSHDAWNDAVLALKKWSMDNKVGLILDYYQL